MSEETRYMENELLNLLDAFKELNSDLDVKVVFQNIILQMAKLLDAEAGTLWVTDPDRDVIKATAVYGPTSSNILKVELKMDEGIVGKVICSGKLQLISDVSTDPAWAPRVDKDSGFTTKSMLTVPLIAKGKAIGAMQLLNKKNGQNFTRKDAQMALVLANQSALALYNSQMFEEIQNINLSMIRTLAKTLDKRDPYTAGHSERVATYSKWMALKIGLDTKTCEELYKAALLHDIGKIGIPDEILRKPTKLSNEEYEIIKKHPEIGADILSTMEPKRTIMNAVETARYHHERLNGSGYPDQLAGKEIPLFAKIVGIADTFDAMTTDRPYNKGLSYHEAAKELMTCKDTHFDEALVIAFLTALEERKYITIEEGHALEGR
ncbi:HD domain-containing phosphohydrolase [Peribacillus sp. NPDC097224]